MGVKLVREWPLQVASTLALAERLVMQTRPYGTWTSPITTADLTNRSVRLSQVRVDGADTYWVEGRAHQGGRRVLLRHHGYGVTEEVLPMIEDTELPNVLTRVHEYGGRAYAVDDGLVVFSHGGNNRVYSFNTRRPAEGVQILTALDERRYGDFEIAPVRGLVYAVCEDHRGEGEPVNTLVAIPLDGSVARGDEDVRTIVSGTDFVSAPTLSPDGTKLAWLTWNHPHMPWTQSQLHVGALDFDGNVTEVVTLIDEDGVCVYEPRWTLSGDLVHVDDSSGWANLYRTEGFNWEEGETADAWTSRLRTRRLHPSQKAFSHPHWQLGLHSFDNLDGEHLICSWGQDGYWHLGSVRLDNGQLEQWQVPWWPVGNVAAGGGRVIMLADSGTDAPAVVEIRDGQARQLRSSTYTELEPDLVSQAQAFTCPTRDGAQTHGFFYPPANPDFAAPEGEKPPLIVMVHGGPTSAARPGLSMEKQFWTSRGFAVADINHRGSTGWGREYRAALDGNWGQMDVDDCADAVSYLVAEGLVDPQRVAIRGGSAGGFTTLAALGRSDVFTAGTCLYGVADLRLLAEQTHKFESRYINGLLGVDDLDDPVVKQRSPLTHVADINAPLLWLQGEDDKVVPPSQAHVMVDALKAQGNQVELKLYPEEGHGFLKQETIHDAMETELAFYRRTWGIE